MVETGKSKPSADMILRLADQLHVPLRDRNRLLLAASFAPRYPERPLHDDALSAAHDAVRRVLRAHEPYPAVVFDRRWNIVMTNRAVDPFFAQVAPDLLRPPVNLVRLGLDPRGLARMVVNLADVRAVFRTRISRQLAAAPDPELTAIYEELLTPEPDDTSSQRIESDVVIPMILRVDGRELRLFSTITTFGPRWTSHWTRSRSSRTTRPTRKAPPTSRSRNKPMCCYDDGTTILGLDRRRDDRRGRRPLADDSLDGVVYHSPRWSPIGVTNLTLVISCLRCGVVVSMRRDTAAEASLEQIYRQADPRLYYDTLRGLRYCLPQLGKPYFECLIQEYRETTGVSNPLVLDVGCAYGTNAALLKYGLTMADLFRHYGAHEVFTLSRNELLSRDRELIASRGTGAAMCFIGLDTSPSAPSYAMSAGLIDAVVYGDLEADEPTRPQLERLSRADIVICTGRLDYAIDRTIVRIAGANQERKPWMVLFVPRMLTFEPIAWRLAGLGYETLGFETVFKHRRFITARERTEVLDALSLSGTNPQGLETRSWLYSLLFVAVPNGVKPLLMTRPDLRLIDVPDRSG